MKVIQVASLVGALRWVVGHPDGRVKTGIWDDPYWQADKFKRWFSGRLDEKVSSHMPGQNWRKMQPGYQADLRRDARIIQDYGNRVRHYGCSCLLSTPEMKARFPHIDNQPRED